MKTLFIASLLCLAGPAMNPACAADEPADEVADQLPHGTVAFGADFEIVDGITFFCVVEATKPDAPRDKPASEVVAMSSLSIGLSRGAKVAGWHEQERRYWFVHCPITGVALTFRTMSTPRAADSLRGVLRAIQRPGEVAS